MCVAGAARSSAAALVRGGQRWVGGTRGAMRRGAQKSDRGGAERRAGRAALSGHAGAPRALLSRSTPFTCPLSPLSPPPPRAAPPAARLRRARAPLLGRTLGGRSAPCAHVSPRAARAHPLLALCIASRAVTRSRSRPSCAHELERKCRTRAKRRRQGREPTGASGHRTKHMCAIAEALSRRVHLPVAARSSLLPGGLTLTHCTRRAGTPAGSMTAARVQMMRRQSLSGR